METIGILILCLAVFVAWPTGFVLVFRKGKQSLGARVLFVGLIGFLGGPGLGAYDDHLAREAGWTSASDRRAANKAGFSDPKLWQATAEARAEQERAALKAANEQRAKKAIEAAKQEFLRREAAAQEAARVKAEKEAKEAACREDLQCWGDKHSVAAAFKCDDAIEQLAKYDFECTDKWHEPKFSHFRWKNKAAGHVTYLGDKIKFQNGFGAFQVHTYACDFDPETRTVLSVSARPGRL